MTSAPRTGKTASRKIPIVCVPVLLLRGCWRFKSLIALHQAKPLSFREKKMLERARYLLVSELAMSRNCDETKVEELLALALAKCNLRFPEASEFQA